MKDIFHRELKSVARKFTAIHRDEFPDVQRVAYLEISIEVLPNLESLFATPKVGEILRPAF